TRADIWPEPGLDGRLRGDGRVTKEDVRAILRLVASLNSRIDAGHLVFTLAGQTDAGSLDGVGSNASFADPYDIAIAPGGFLYGADASGHRIRRIRADGSVETFCGSGRRGFQDGDAKTACFNGPYSLAFASDGSLFVADRYNHRIRRIAPDGAVSTFAGT